MGSSQCRTIALPCGLCSDRLSGMAIRGYCEAAAAAAAAEETCDMLATSLPCSRLEVALHTLAETCIMMSNWWAEPGMRKCKGTLRARHQCCHRYNSAHEEAETDDDAFDWGHVYEHYAQSIVECACTSANSACIHLWRQRAYAFELVVTEQIQGCVLYTMSTVSGSRGMD